ncbi:hypothetical protein J7K43_07740 [Candidatus Calescamantes bacterium]|nr:hypothetical protein [Candidatus Calescamantes bacterium]
MKKEIWVEPIDFIKALNQKDVRYLLVGRQALVQYGAPLQSFDYDFFVSPDEETLHKIKEVAEELGMEIYPEDPWKSPKLTLYSDNLKVDIFRAKRYSLGEGKFLEFEEMFQRKSVVKRGDFFIYLPSLEDLKKSKMLRDSPKDREDIKYIEFFLSKKRRTSGKET